MIVNPSSILQVKKINFCQILSRKTHEYYVLTCYSQEVFWEIIIITLENKGHGKF